RFRPFATVLCRPYRMAALAVLLLAATPVLAAQTLDRIVAVVNDDVVLASELAQEIDNVIVQLRQRGTPIPDRNILTRQVLARLIVHRLQPAVAVRSGIRVDATTVSAAVQRSAEPNKLNCG